MLYRVSRQRTGPLEQCQRVHRRARRRRENERGDHGQELPTSTRSTGVRETYFHELFHLNDFDHNDWSKQRLAKDYAAIVKQCGTRVTCLEPYAPNTTKVRATGTYYAFQPNNGDGVHEYAAELAVRYWKEQSEMLSAGKLSRRAFKCGTPENARSWKALIDEFFGGRDLTPACPTR